MSDNHLNIQSLFNSESLKQRKEKQVFEKIVGRCHQKIKSCADFRKFNCNFEIPTYMFGEIMYDFGRSRKYLIERLRSEKFIVRECSPTSIFICWDYDALVKEHKHINLPKRDDIFNQKLPKEANEPRQDVIPVRHKQPVYLQNVVESSELRPANNPNPRKIIPYRPTGAF